MIKSLLVLLVAAALTIPLHGQNDVEPFLPDVFVNLPHVRDLAVNQQGSEIFFTIDAPKHQVGFIATATIEDFESGEVVWSKPRIVSFSGRYRDIEPFLSEDGNRLYFASNRPVEAGETAVKDYDIYYVERAGERKPWGEPVRLPETVNTSGNEYYPSINNNGDLFFTSAREGAVGAEDIFVARWNGKSFDEPVPVPGDLNTGGYEYNAFVDPADRFILFTSYRERDGRRRNDLYISLRNADGSYNEALLVPGICSDAIDYCPFVHEGTGKLYFTSERSELPDHFDSTLDLDGFMKAVSETPNGTSRVYQVDFGPIWNALNPDE